MSKIKPGRIEDEVAVKEIPLATIEEEDELFYENIEEAEKERVTAIKGIGVFAKKSLVVFGLLFSVILIGTLYDASMTISSMMSNAPFIGILYLFSILGLVGVLGYGLFKEYLSVMRLKNIDTLQERGSVLKKNPTKDVIAYAKEIIERYENHDSELIRENALSLKRELPSLMYDEVLERLNEKLFNPLDKLAKGSIVKYANQTALSTAISPVAFIDAILIISRSGAMVNEIATIYGYKPNFIGKILLFKKIFFVLVFASVTEILAQHSHDLVGTSIVSKFSYHAAQGIANGILTARVGVAAIKSCRPMHYKDQNEGFLKGISKKIMESVFKFGGNKNR